jgi:hypothetical protein
VNESCTESHEPCTELHESPPNHKPLTTNHKPIDKDKSLSVSAPYEKIKAAYHEHCPSLPSVVVLSDKRKAHIKKNWNFFLNPKNLIPNTDKPWATDEESGLKMFARFFKSVEESDFLTGRKCDRNGDTFNGCGLDWLMKEENFLKVVEGKYKNQHAEVQA